MLSHYCHTLPHLCRRNLDWIRVSHVCQYWREVAINTPELWVYPPIHLRRWGEEMLLRSKTLPVILEAGPYVEYLDNFVHDRIGELHVGARGTEIGSLLQR